MGLLNFGPKKSDSVKPLSEFEIQSKLYGGLRKPHIEEKKNEHKKSSASDFFNTSSAKQPKFQSSSTDLLEHRSTSHTPAPSKEDSPAVGAVKDWVKQENQTFKRLNQTQQTQKETKTSVKNSPSFDFLKKASAALSAFGLAVVGTILQVFAKAASFTIQLLLKSPKNLPFLGVAFLVFSIFWGIHSMNISRERAMKNPGKKPVVAVKSVSTHVLSEVAVSTGQIPSKAVETQNAKSVAAAPSATTPEKRVAATTAGAEALDKPYVVQVATYLSMTDAEAKSKEFREMGFTSFIQSMKRQNGRVYHIVFLGRFKTFEAANYQYQKFKKKDAQNTFQDAFIRTLK